MGVFHSTPHNALAVPQKEREHEHSSNAPWAMVTGATTGIGRDIAHELGSRGLNLVVHGRNGTALDQLAADIRIKHGVQVKILILDASTAFNPESHDETIEKLAEIESLNLKVLVNNVGTGHDPNEFKTFSKQTIQEINTIINVNTTFMTHLTHALLPTLKERGSPSDFGFVINAGSLADIGLPYASVYAGTKGYLRSFSQALDTELNAEGAHVRVVASIIGDTDSDGHRVGVNLFTPSSADMARMIVQSAATSIGGPVVPYGLHKIQVWACILQPYSLLRMGMGMHMKTLVGEYAKQK